MSDVPRWKVGDDVRVDSFGNFYEDGRIVRLVHYPDNSPGYQWRYRVESGGKVCEVGEKMVRGFTADLPPIEDERARARAYQVEWAAANPIVVRSATKRRWWQRA